MKRRICLLLVLLMMAGLLSGCSRWEEVDPDEPFVYYLTMEGTGIEKREFDWKGENTKEEVQIMLDALSNPDESGKLRAAIPEDVEVKNFVLENEKLELHFSKGYRKMNSAQEVLCRAAVVQSLVQIDGVEWVKIYVDDEPIQDKDGMEIGYVGADDFVQNTGESLSSYQKVELSLWIPDKEGEVLVNENREIRYSSSVSVEKVIIEQLMTKKAMTTELIIMPPETKLLGVTVKDGICYVNFDEGFQIAGYTLNPELSIYSIVNSIVDNSTASQVQISINGKTDVKFQNVVDLSKPLMKNEELVEEK